MRHNNYIYLTKHYRELISRDMGGHYILIQAKICHEDIEIVHIYAAKHKVAMFIKETV